VLLLIEGCSGEVPGPRYGVSSVVLEMSLA